MGSRSEYKRTVERPWSNAIVGHGEESPEHLLANEHNWRLHPSFQKQVVKDSLSQVGWIQEVIVNIRSSDEWGSRKNIPTVIDGHLRVLLAIDTSQEKVPVTYVDLTPQQEYAALLMLDESANLAAKDTKVLEELVNLIDEKSDTVNELLKKMDVAKDWLTSVKPLQLEQEYHKQQKKDDKKLNECPKCGFRW